MLMIRKNERNHPVVGVADTWETFETAKLNELKEMHAQHHPESPWDASWETHYKETYIDNCYYAEKVENYWKG